MARILIIWSALSAFSLSMIFHEIAKWAVVAAPVGLFALFASDDLPPQRRKA